MNFSAIPNTSPLGKLLRFPLRFIPDDAVFPILQGRLRSKRWIANSGMHGYWLGTFESEKQAVFCDTIVAGSVVYDIGAHVGFYTLLASELVGPSGRVIAFEPNPRNLYFFKRHLDLNRCRNVTVIEAAVSDKSGKAFFEDCGTCTGHLGPHGQLEVNVACLDELVAKEIIPAPNYIKMDIEGAEFGALLGAKALLTDHHPVIFLATHGRDVHKQCCDLLIAWGYRLQSITSEPVEKSDELMVYPGPDHSKI